MRSRLSKYKQGKLIEHFVAVSTARAASEIVGVNKSTAAYYFHRLRVIIANEMEEEGQEYFATGLNLILELVQDAGKLFRSSNLDRKRKLLNLVFQNLSLINGKVQYSLNKPFELFLDSTKCTKWLGWQDSNLRMPIPKTGALPLGYTPIILDARVN